MRVIFFGFCAIAFLFFSCSGKKEPGVITFNLAKSDYSDKINVEGTVQAVVNFPVIPPNPMFYQMTVLRLSDDGAFIRKGDTICVLTVPEVESMYREAVTSVETLEAGLKKTEADNKLNIALIEAQLATCEAQLKISSLDTLKMKFAAEVPRRLLELELKRAHIEKQKAEKKLAATRLIGETDIRQMKARIIQEKTKVQTMADQMNSMTIIAQRDGLVTRAESPKIYFFSSSGMGSFGGPVKEGSVMFPGRPVLQFPDLSLMQVSAEVAEADFRAIEKGQKVSITVDAANRLVTTGKVNRKSLMGRTAERYSDSKVKFYEVIIDVDSCHSKMKPGLSAMCEITLSEASDTLFVPSLSIFERDSSKIVYVLDKENFLPVKVETGASGSSYTLITGGLKGGEIIALSEPPNNLIRKERPNENKAKGLDSINIKPN
jgi:multidrug efflux pump subunit AcrA (membrane-fusion protein)